jgi:hypothetical protein
MFQETVGTSVSGMVKQYQYSPGKGLRVSEVWGYHISRESAHKGGKFARSKHWPT